MKIGGIKVVSRLLNKKTIQVYNFRYRIRAGSEKCPRSKPKQRPESSRDWKYEGEPYLTGEAAIIIPPGGCSYFLLTAVYCEE